MKEATDFLRDFTSSICEHGKYYLIEEYYIQENDYKYDEDLEEWSLCDGSGNIWEFSKMVIKLVEEPSYEVVGVFDNMKEAKKAKEDYIFSEGKECFLSFI